MSKAKTLANTVSTGGSVAATNGGTGQTGFTTGDILYSSATDTLAKLAIGSAGQVLKVAAGVPTWATDSTGSGTVTSVAATVPSIFSISGSPITTSGTLAMTYSGTPLPIANGGTGTTSTTFVDAATNVTGTLPVANGGTGQTALSAVSVGTSTNIAGGSNGTIPYQSASGTTQMLAAGTAGYLLQSNGAAAPSWVTVPAAGQNTFVATGSITQGNPVTLRSDGTVEVTTGDVGAYSAGTATGYFTATGTSNGTVVYDTGADRYVFVYSNDAIGGYPAAKVGTLSGTTFSYGTEVILESVYAYVGVKAVYEPAAAKTVIFSSPANTVRSWVCTVSGSTLTAGGSADFASTNTTNSYCVSYHPPSGKIVVGYSQGEVRLKMGTVSGTSISTGSQYVVASGAQTTMSLAYHAASGNMAIFYNTGTGYWNANAFSISGTVPTIGSTGSNTTGLLSSSAFSSAVYSPTSQRILFTFPSYDGGYRIETQIVNVSGTTITFGNLSSITGFECYSGQTVYDTTYSRLNLIVCNDTAQTARFYAGTDTTTSVTWATAVNVGSGTYNSSGQNAFGIAYNPTGQNTAVSIRRSSNSGNQGVLLTGSLASNFTTWIGMSTQTVTNGQNVVLTTLSGVNDYQSGLTTGSVYYVNYTGALTTTATSVKVGRALSATKLLVTGAGV